MEYGPPSAGRWASPVGPVNWGTRSRDVFILLCERIEADGHGPAPIPVYVSKPDHEGFATARFVPGDYGTARETAELMAAAWESWAGTNEKYRDTVAYLAD